MLINIHEAMLHLRVEPGDEEAMIALYLGAAEQVVADFLNRNVYPDQAALDAAVAAGQAGAQPIIVNYVIKAAVLLILGHLYANREDVVVGPSAAPLPTGARALLRPHRLFPGF